MTLSVVLPTRNRAETLRAALEAMARQALPEGCAAEVLVVDNGSTDHTARIVAALQPTFPLPLRLVAEPRPGKPYALNAGIRQARGEWLVFTDDDVIAEPGWLAAIWRGVRETPAQALAGRVVPHWTDGRPAWLTDKLLERLGALGLFDFGPQRLTLHPAAREYWWVGSNIALRRDLLERVGGFDVRRLRGQDTDLYARCAAAGATIVYEPAATVAHRVGADRLTPAYFRAWHCRAGHYRAYGMPWRPHHLLTILPLHGYREIARWASRWVRSALTREEAWARLVYECRLRSALSQFACRLKQWPGPGGAARLAALAAGGLAAGLGLYAIAGTRLIAAAYDQTAWDWVNRFVSNREVSLEVHLARGRLLLSRAAFLWVAASAAALAWAGRARVEARLREFFGASAGPLNLAVVRVAVFATLFRMANLDQALWFGQMPEALRSPAFGSGWLAALVPTTESWVRTAWIGLRAACVLAAVGLWTRPAAGVAALLAVYVLGIPQWFGKVTHYHHLVWFAALLAASPCGDALSVDAWLRRGRGRPAPSRAYGLPLRFMWLLLGTLYFFPGFWKWWASGIDWVWSENLKFWMYGKWAEGSGWMPLWRIDRWPLAYRLGGAATVLFEMGFVWCLFLPRLRAAAALAGLGFHYSMRLFMNIPFSHLLPLYVVFVDWESLARRLQGRRDEAAVRHQARATWPAVAIGALLLAGNLYCGVRGIEQGWPLSAYPTFRHLKSPTVSSVHVEVLGADGIPVVLEQGTLRRRASTVRWKALLSQVLRTRDEGLRRSRLAALWALWRREDEGLVAAREVRFYRVTRSLAPEDRDAPPVARELLWTMPVSASAADGPGERT
jgi:glycosyltransferase involved in cell wall biosynthesis